MLNFLPLSRREIIGHWPSPRTPTMGNEYGIRNRCGADELQSLEDISAGQLPELATQPKRGAALWHASYVQTYLERDLRMLRQVGDL